MNVLGFKVDFVNYGLYLHVPLLGYVVVSVLRNAFIWYKGQKKEEAVTKKLFQRQGMRFRFSIGSLLILVAAICFVAAFRMQMLGRGTILQWFALWMIPFMAYGLLNRYRAYRFQIVRLVVNFCGLAMILLLTELNCSTQDNVRLLLSMPTELPTVIQNSFFMLLSWFGGYLLIECYYIIKGGLCTYNQTKKENVDDNLFPKAHMGAVISCGFIFTVALTLIVGILVERSGLQLETTILEIAREYFSQPVHILNIYLLLFVCGVLFFAFGEGTGSLLSLFVVAFIYVANYIKIEYHNTFFTWFDLLQVKEMLLMGKEFLNFKIVVLIICVVVLLVSLIVIFRKPLGRFLRIRPRVLGVVAATIVLLFFGNLIYKQKFESMNILPRTWENEAVNVEYNGLIINLIHNLKTFSEIQMDKPEGYTQEMAESVKEKFDAIEIPEAEDVQPDVILILAESLFDLEDVQGITLSQDIDATVDAYSAGTLISPRYGGYTSAMEFESLTGLSLAYMPNSLTPYTTYFNNPEEEFPCIVREFEKNGYHTVAVHPDLPNFYNRTTVYQVFGFDEYLAVHDFDMSQENLTDNGFFKDIPFGNRLIEELQQATEPTFLFGISMEGHYVTLDKYAEPLVKATSDVLSEEQLNQIEQQATSYYYTDKMIANIIEYMDTTDRPTLLYIYGDHLPPVEEFSDLGFVNEKYGKYSTSLVMYSNYKSISTGTEYITPNQLAAQIMVDSGIEYSSYYDYIYSIRESYPVLHKEFVQVEGNPDLEDYYFLQYDLLAGERYLYEKE